MARRQFRDEDDRILGVKIHPTMHRELRMLAAADECTISDALHRILCERFERLDLLSRDPGSVVAS